jgi:hypothetical protein
VLFSGERDLVGSRQALVPNRGPPTDAIHVHQNLDSDALYLPQVRPLIGKNVEIIVREQSDASTPVKGCHPRRDVWEAALANLKGLNVD